MRTLRGHRRTLNGVTAKVLLRMSAWFLAGFGSGFWRAFSMVWFMGASLAADRGGEGTWFSPGLSRIWEGFRLVLVQGLGLR